MTTSAVLGMSARRRSGTDDQSFLCDGSQPLVYRNGLRKSLKSQFEKHVELTEIAVTALVSDALAVRIKKPNRSRLKAGVLKHAKAEA
jgi:superfamily II DNA or RNA helicase